MFKKGAKLSHQLAEVENLFQVSSSKNLLVDHNIQNVVSSKKSSNRDSIFANVHYSAQKRKPRSILKHNHEELGDM